MHIKATVQMERAIHVHPGLEVARRVYAHLTPASDEDPRGVSIDMLLVFYASLGHYVVQRLELDAGSVDVEISGRLLRTLPIQRYIRDAAILGAPYPPEYNPDRLIDRMSNEEFEQRRTRGPNEELLWSVAFAYRAAEIRQENPAKHVAGIFALQQRTATNWIRRARELGMFDRDAPGISRG